MGAWGYGPFDNDSACDWRWKLDEIVAKAFKPALKPLRPQDVLSWEPPAPRLPRSARRKGGSARARAAFRAWQRRLGAWKKKRQRKKSKMLGLVYYCHEGALAAIELVLSFPALHRSTMPRDYEGPNFVQLSKSILLTMKKDEAHISGWREPEKFVKELDRQLGRARRILRAQRVEDERRYRDTVKRVRKMTKRQRDAEFADSGKSGYWSEDFKRAFKQVDGRELVDGPMPKTSKIRARHAKRRRKA